MVFTTKGPINSSILVWWVPVICSCQCGHSVQYCKWVRGRVTPATRCMQACMWMGWDGGYSVWFEGNGAGVGSRERRIQLLGYFFPVLQESLQANIGQGVLGKLHNDRVGDSSHVGSHHGCVNHMVRVAD